MPLELRWTDDLDRVAHTRMLCYAHGGSEDARYQEGIRSDPRATANDFLLAELDGAPVGTTTSLSMTMWVRGGAIRCQGVGFVGTIKTHRRSGHGIATKLMHETLRVARERGQVVSALMPFRASYYEHFGYGLVERRNEWTLPLDVLPRGGCDGMRSYSSDDLAELVAFRLRLVERGQCDIERDQRSWEWWLRRAEAGLVFVDRQPDGRVHGFMFLEHAHVHGRDVLRVMQSGHEDAAALQRQLHFLSSLRDQYGTAVLTLPIEVPLNWLLRESQLPHRPVNHATAELRAYTRMQVRVLDHQRFLEALRLPAGASGRVTVSVQESEGHASRFGVEIGDGRARLTTPATAEVTFDCPDRVWAAVACGDLPASQAVQWGLASASDAAAANVLDLLAQGSLPFCTEYF